MEGIKMPFQFEATCLLVSHHQPTTELNSQCISFYSTGIVILPTPPEPLCQDSEQKFHGRYKLASCVSSNAPR